MSGGQIVIIGAGPSGIAAALAAAAAGLKVIVFDLFDQPGGQIYRALSPGLTPTGTQPADFMAGETLRAEFATARLDYRPRHLVWHISQSLGVHALGPDGPVVVAADALVIATGAMERVVPFAGWTSSRVLGMAAATILFKSDRMAPGKRVILAGRGPLLAAVAHSTREAGQEIAAIIDRHSISDWLAVAPRMLARPDLLAKGLSWAVEIKKSRAPLLSGFRVEHAVQQGEGIAVVARPVSGGGSPIRIDGDVLCVGDGLMPDIALAGLLGLDIRRDVLDGSVVTSTTAGGRASRSRVYVTGDAAGIGGALTAWARGHQTGLAVASDLGAARVEGNWLCRTRNWVSLVTAEVFAGASRRLMAVGANEYRAAKPDTLFCRCEDVTLAEVKAALAEGAININQLKAWTRGGMGPCQGRNCRHSLAACLDQAASRLDQMIFSGRGPIRPIPLDGLLGDFRYEDIPGIGDLDAAEAALSKWR